MKTATFLSEKKYLLFLFSFLSFTFFSQSVFSQCPPTAAAFTLNPASGTSVPHTVFFTDGSTLPDTWFWDFGDGNTSTAQNPIHSYTSFGIYTVKLVVRDTIFGCSDSTTAIVSICGTSAITSQTNVSCNGGSNGSLTVTQTGGAANFSYAWSNGSTTSNTASTTNTISSLVAGTYTVTVTDNNGCTSTASSTVTQPTSLGAIIFSQTNVDCNGNATGSLSSSGTGGTTPYTYSWSNGATSFTTSGLLAATYTVTITDNNSCTAVTSSTVTEPTALGAIIFSQTNVDCNGNATGSLSSSGTGGTTPYTYSWSNGATSFTTSGLLAATYTVTITDNNSCTAVTSSTVTEPTALGASITAQTNVDCNGNTSGSLTSSGSGGTSPYTYSWSQGSTTASISGLAASTYTVTITDNNACTATTSSTVTEPAALSVSFSTTDNLCFGDANGIILSTPSGGTSPYTYSWNDGPTAANRNNLVANTYTLTVTDANGCTTSNSATITERPDLLVSLTPTNVSCNGGSDGAITANASGGTSAYTYLWSNSATTSAIVGLAAGTYTLTVTDAFGCTEISSTTLTEPGALTSVAFGSNVSCNGLSDGSIIASVNSGGTAPFTYLWSNSATTSGISSIPAGTYTVTITDANGCTTVRSRTITEPSSLTATISAQTNVSCNGLSDGSLSVAAGGGTAAYTYSWSQGSTTSSITGLNASTYTVTVTDNNGCTATTSATIIEPGVLTSVAFGSNVSCNGLSDGSIIASVNSGGTAPFTYLWSNSATTSGISSIPAGTYTVTITDANGCTTVRSRTITEPAVLAGTIGSQSNVSCNGGSDGSATATATGGTAPYTYSWSNTVTTAANSALIAGIYTVTITDAKGCTDTDLTTITEPAALIVMTVVDSNASGFGVPDGGASTNVMGGTTPYTYAWNNSATTPSIAGVVAGTYTVTVTDANACTGISSVTISEPSNLTVSTSFVSPLCNGDANGSASVAQVNGGVPPYSYNWSTSDTLPLIINVGAGTYTVTVTDNNGNSTVDSAVVTEPTAISVNMLEATTSCANSTNGAAIALASGGTSPYTFNWSNSQITNSLSNVSVGTYTLTVTDANGCIFLDSAVINSGDTIPPAAMANDTTLLLDANGQLIIRAGDINDGSNDNCSLANLIVLNDSMDCSNIGANIVELVAIDSDGNRDTATATVTVVDGTAPTIITQSYTTFLDANKEARFTASNLDNGTFDACGLDTVWVDTSIVFGCADIGSNVVMFYATDIYGNLDSASATVVVADSSRRDTILQKEHECGSYTWPISGQTYTMTGTYGYDSLDANSCFVAHYELLLTVDVATSETDTIVACDSYMWRDGNVYTSSNSSATFILKNNINCDSIIYNLDLTINSSDSSTLEKDSACTSYTWAQNNQTFTSSGIYTHTVTNANGCDSIITLDLEIRPLYLQVINMSDSLFAFENNDAATYQWIDCSDNSIIPGATSRGYKPDTTGFFKVVVSNGLCSDTSVCEEVIFIGLDEESKLSTELNIYPNPTSQDFFFETTRLGENEQLMVVDLNGKVILQKTVDQLKMKIETVNWNAGIYFVRYNDQIKKLVITR